MNFGQLSKFWVQYLSVIIAALVMISDGMQYGWASPAVPRLLQNHSSIYVTKEASKWITQSYIIGNITGVIVSVCIFNSLSRKMSIFVAGLTVLLGWIGNLLAPSLIILCLARYIGGIGRNMAFVALPMYIGEVADPNVRGILGSFMYLSMNFGVLVVYSITPYTPLYVPAIVGISIIGIQMVLLKFIPESPYYLVLKGNKLEAKQSLIFLRRSNDVDEELQEISAAVERQTFGSNKYLRTKLNRLFTKKSNQKALVIILVLRSLQMFSGVSVMTMHIHTIFEQAGGKFSPEISAIVYGVVMLVANLCTATVADRFGRKSLLLFSCSTTFLLLAAQGVYFFLKIQYDYNLSAVYWLPVFNVLAFALVYKVGLGTVPIVMVSELFPADVKVAGVVLADLMYSISSLICNAIFEYTEDALGMYTPFWIFSACCFFGIIFAKVVLPETRGRTLEQIQVMLLKKHSRNVNIQ